MLQISKVWRESQEVLVVFVNYFFLLDAGPILVYYLRLGLVYILGLVLGFILGFVNVFRHIDTLFNDGGFFYMVYLESTPRKENSSDKSKKHILHYNDLLY